MELNVIQISTMQSGGAGIAACRLHHSLIAADVSSKFLYLNNGTQLPSAICYRRRSSVLYFLNRAFKKVGMPLTLDQSNDYKIRKYKRRFELFSFSRTPYVRLHQHTAIRCASIVHLHWISDFVNFETFFSNVGKPIVWTLHDMNPFQGGFHYKGDEQFASYLNGLDSEQYQTKRASYACVRPDRLIVVSPSNWLKKLAEQSELLGRFRHFHIPNPVNVSIFKPVTRGTQVAQKIKVLFVAESLNNYRKGFDLLLDALNRDLKLRDLCEFSAVGRIQAKDRLPFINYLGTVSSEEEMASLYGNSDIFVLPSREDNLPNSMIESLCCGTPVVGFRIGGLTETIIDGENGFLAAELTPESLANSLMACIYHLSNMSRSTISRAAHQKYCSAEISRKYLEIYQQILKAN